MHRECDHDGAVFSNSDVDVRREDWKQLEEDPMAKREDSICFFCKHRDAAIIASLGNVPAIRHLLQHSRRSARWINVLCSDGSKKTSVKLNEVVIYWEQVALYAACNNHTPLRGEQQATIQESEIQ